MTADTVYHQLADHLDRLPCGFPPSDSGVELRILRRLFAPDEAALALHTTLLPEEPRVVARRAGRPLDETAAMLETMASKGLLFALYHDDKPPTYMAAQYVIGLFEWQVHRMTPELAADLAEYFETFGQPEWWQRGPQIRTVPVGESIAVQHDVLDYERAEALVERQTHFAVAPCVCRVEQGMLGHDCDKPLETCLVFGSAAAYYVRQGMGRTIDKAEALRILQKADRAGLVLQPGNAKKASSICCCCGDCCGVLRAAKKHPKPATVLASPFTIAYERDRCTGCGLCLTRCQMEAVDLDDDCLPVFDLDRCIGCGLCVTTCATEALSLMRKPKDEQPYVPATLAEANIRLAMAGGKMGLVDMAGLVVRSKVDRLLAK